jgi:Ca2+-binding EF-hand superfamily protein
LPHGPDVGEDNGLLEICKLIGQKAAQKFSTVREAFRFINPDHKGRISRSDVHYFFRAYGIDATVADRFLGFLDADARGGVDWKSFVALLRPHIQPTSSAPAGAHEEEDELEELRLASFQQEFQHVLELVRLKAPQRFSHVREVLRIVDGDYDGFITRQEMQYFFRSFGIHEGVSDHFFDRLGGGSGRASYAAFVAQVGPYLELPGSEAVTQHVGRCAGIRAARPPSLHASAGLRPASREGAGENEQRVYDKYAYWCEVESENLKEGLMEVARREARTPSQDRVRAVQDCRRTIAQMGLRNPDSRPSSATRGRASSDSRPSSAAGRASGARRPMGITSTSHAPLSVGQAQQLCAETMRGGPGPKEPDRQPAADSAVRRGGLPVARPLNTGSGAADPE